MPARSGPIKRGDEAECVLLAVGALLLPTHEPYTLILEVLPFQSGLAFGIDSFKHAGHNLIIFFNEPGDQEVFFFLGGLGRRPFTGFELFWVDSIHGRTCG